MRAQLRLQEVLQLFGPVAARVSQVLIARTRLRPKAPLEARLSGGLLRRGGVASRPRLALAEPVCSQIGGRIKRFSGQMVYLGLNGRFSLRCILGVRESLGGALNSPVGKCRFKGLMSLWSPSLRSERAGGCPWGYI
eukprot:1195012-Prorocentrum_minimum.AAC.1